MTPHDLHERDIHLAASHWIVEAADGELSSAQRAEFDVWLAEDPRHRAAWEEMRCIADDIAALDDLTDADLQAPPRASVPSRRRLIWAGAFGAMAASILVVLTVSPDRGSTPRLYAYETKVAQTREIQLSDGTRITLAPKSTLKVAFSDAERHVELAGGHAFFEVAHQADRPFFVKAGSSLVRVVGTKFDMNLRGASLRVAVIEGAVRFSDKPRGSVVAFEGMLRAGQGVDVSRGRPPKIEAVADRSAIDALAAKRPSWVEGRLVYNDARLSTVIPELNAYYAPGVRLASTELGSIRVTGSLRTDEIRSFLQAIETIAPVRAIEQPDGAVLVTSSAAR